MMLYSKMADNIQNICLWYGKASCYVITLLYGTSAYLLNRLQSIRNSSARLILIIWKYDPISTAIRRDLHWLPIQARIRVKMNVITRNFVWVKLQSILDRALPPYQRGLSEAQSTIGDTSSALGPPFSQGACRSTWFLHLIPTTVESTSSRHSTSIWGATPFQKETENSFYAAVRFPPLRILCHQCDIYYYTTILEPSNLRIQGLIIIWFSPPPPNILLHTI